MMKITVLIENTSDGALLREHGLSLFIQYNGKNVLLDAGSTTAFYENAKALGISLDSIDACVLSHGHYDHSGGLEAIFLNHPEVKVYAQKTAVCQYFSGSRKLHDIGIPRNILAYRDRFELIEGCREILDGVYLVPHHTEGLDQIGTKAKLYKKTGESLVPDDFAHEQSLVFETEKGLIVFNSCSHGGVSNIIREVKEALGGRQIYAYVGGFHMKGRVNGEEVCAFSEEEIQKLCRQIEEEKISYVCTGHCTGLPGLMKLQEILGDRVQPLKTGLQLTF